VKNSTGLVRTLIEVRPNSPRWIYLVCAGIVLLFCLMGAEEGLKGIAHLIAIALLSAIQFLRPTLLGWFALFVGFLTYSVAVLLIVAHGGGGNLVFLALGVFPAVALFFCRPKSV